VEESAKAGRIVMQAMRPERSGNATEAWGKKNEDTMASNLFKISLVEYWVYDCWIDAEGQPCSEDTPGARFVKQRRLKPGTLGAKKVKKKSKKWYGRVPGNPKPIALCENKTAAGQILADLIRKAELERAGIRDPFEDHRNRPLSDHLSDWEEVLKARNNTDEYVSLKVSRVQKILEGCKFIFINDLSASRVEACLADMRKESTRFGTQTSNHYLGAIKQFSRWLVKDRRTAENPLAHLEGGNVRLDRRHERRELTDDELVYLFNWTRQARRVRRMSGLDREMLYLAAVYTGLRASELASLTPESFALDDATPTATVEAGYSKHRREDVIPLHAELVRRLRPWLADKAPGQRVWPGQWAKGKEAGVILKIDMQAARAAWIADAKDVQDERVRRERSTFLAYSDADGCVADFHALRHTFISRLVHAGVKPKEAQTLARHSTITLTMDRYAHTGLHDIARAVESLPSLATNDTTRRQEIKATGTDGAGLPPVCRRFVQTNDPDRSRMVLVETHKADGNDPESEPQRRHNSGVLQPVATDRDRVILVETSGEGGIRTLGRLAPTPVFETGARSP
jgi:integrase/recombinase XerD